MRDISKKIILSQMMFLANSGTAIIIVMRVFLMKFIIWIMKFLPLNTFKVFFLIMRALFVNGFEINKASEMAPMAFPMLNLMVTVTKQLKVKFRMYSLMQMRAFIQFLIQTVLDINQPKKKPYTISMIRINMVSGIRSRKHLHSGLKIR